jgi:hypothetical protein
MGTWSQSAIHIDSSIDLADVAGRRCNHSGFTGADALNQDFNCIGRAQTNRKPRR